MRKCCLLWANLCFWSCFISSRRKQLIFFFFFMCDADVPSSCLILDFFFCILLFLNICNTVMMTSCHVEMSAVLFLYVCVQASKEIIKLKSSVYAYISSLCPKQKLQFHWLNNKPPPPLAFFIEKVGLRNMHPHPAALSLCLPLFPPCLPSRAQPRSPFFLFVIHLASSFHCRDKGAQCIVGRLSLKKGPLPCVCCGRDGFMLPPHTKNFPTHSSLMLSF